MIKRWFLKTITALVILLLTVVTYADTNVVNVYNWSDYIPDQVIQLFEKQTGIHVNYSTYSSNQELYNKLKADPNIGYDVVVPSSYTVEKMAREGMLHRLNLNRLPNAKHLNPLLLNRSYDPHNRYSLPYLWGTLGIIINKKYFNPHSITLWRALWSPRFRNQLLMPNALRDTFSVALASMGYSINTENPATVKKAYHRLTALLPNIKLFGTDDDIPVMVDEDATIGVVESGDAVQMMKGNPDLTYVYPKQGVVLWADCMSIPKNAPHLNNAYRFMNFIMRPEIAKMISMKLGYSSPNLTAIRLMPKSIQNNTVRYPPHSVIKHGQMEGYVKPELLQLYLHYWELLKMGPGSLF